MEENLSGKVAFITGLARGQGRAHALRLAAAGVDIVGIDICKQIPSVAYEMSTAADLDETVRLVKALGRRIVARIGDVRDAASIKIAYDEGIATLGRIDFIIANAGIMPAWGAGSETIGAWQDCLDVLLTGVLNTVEVAIPHLLAQDQGGSIVIVSSMASTKPMMRTVEGRTLGLLGYCAAKAALVNLSQNYASILGYHRIRVNTIHPTGVRTPMIDNEVFRNRVATATSEDRKMLVPAIPLDALEPEDVANAVLWLCSDDSRYYTGNAMRIDAGASLR